MFTHSKEAVQLRKQLSGSVLPFVVEDRQVGEREQDIHKKRRERMEAVCNRRKNNGTRFPVSRYRAFYFNDAYKCVYCSVPKAGTTNWKRILLVLQGDTNSTVTKFREVHSHHFPTLRNVTDDRLSNYTTFLFTREPFSRLLSAFIDKFETPDDTVYDWAKWGKKVAKKYRKQNGNTDNGNVTFVEFIQYLIDPATNPSKMDPHWRPVYLMCNICNMRYDFIGRIEHFKEDAYSFLKLINASDVVKSLNFPSDNFHSTNASEKLYPNYYAKVPHEYLVRLYKRYELDFELFGYEEPNIISLTNNT
ncbi:carbohydrate sulfotransferase 8-like [Glandiceps talaboti]